MFFPLSFKTRPEAAGAAPGEDGRAEGLGGRSGERPVPAARGMTRACRRNARPVGGYGGLASTRSSPSVRGRPAVLKREQKLSHRIDEPSPYPARGDCLRAAVATLLGRLGLASARPATTATRLPAVQAKPGSLQETKGLCAR